METSCLPEIVYIGCSPVDQIEYHYYYFILTNIHALFLVFGLSIVIYKKINGSGVLNDAYIIFIFCLANISCWLAYDILLLINYGWYTRMINFIIFTLVHMSIYFPVCYTAFVWLEIQGIRESLKKYNQLSLYNEHFWAVCTTHAILSLGSAILVGIFVYYDILTGYLICARIFWGTIVIFAIVVIIILLRYGYICYQDARQLDRTLSSKIRWIIFFVIIVGILSLIFYGFYTVMLGLVEVIPWMWLTIHGFYALGSLIIVSYFMLIQIIKIKISSSSN